MIDDFFAISVEPAHEAAEQSRSFLLHGKAQQPYESQKILGSPSKDVLASDYAKVPIFIRCYIKLLEEARIHTGQWGYLHEDTVQSYQTELC